MMHDAGFDLQNWSSNSSELMNKIEINEKHGFINIEKIIFDLHNLFAEVFKRVPTKRWILSISSKILDRLGLLSPILRCN